MPARTEFPFEVRVVDHFWIELTDGTRLAARAWLPVQSDTEPVPAILEYLPYRKGDGTDVEDAARHGYFAGHGFASVRVDIRGTGDSSGNLTDEYSAEELADGVEVVGWLAEQRWCNGRVGLIGISWGGFNALQIAALRPAALGAIVTVCSTDNRFADDVHYMGGAVLAHDMLGWAMTLLAFNARPPDPNIIGASWRDVWLDRIRATPVFIDRWLAHSTFDAYWRHGSVCEDYAAITCPVLAVGGWADGYTNAVFRLLDNLPGVKRGIIGPWAHAWPHSGRPGPRIGFLQECVRWWNRWLRDERQGAEEDEPLARVWLMDAASPQAAISAGVWRGGTLEHDTLTFSLSPQRVVTDLRHGEAAGAWCPFGAADLAMAQSADDARSVCIDQLLSSPLELLGRPRLTFTTADAMRGGHLVVRLCEVDSSGCSTLLTWGVGRLADGCVELNAIGRRVSATNTLRLALARSYWPVVWPARDLEAVELTNLRLTLPQWRKGAPVEFAPAEAAASGPFESLERAAFERRTEAGNFLQRVDSGRIRHGNGIVVRTLSEDRLTIDPLNAASAAAVCDRRIEMSGDGWQVEVIVTGAMRVIDDEFAVSVTLTALEAGMNACEPRSWTLRVPRPLD